MFSLPNSLDTRAALRSVCFEEARSRRVLTLQQHIFILHTFCSEFCLVCSSLSEQLLATVI